jgi:tetratricopeptide (TPR) repeat protein
LVEITQGTRNALEIVKNIAEKHPQNSRVLAAMAELYSSLNELDYAIQNAQAALNTPDNSLSRQEYLAALTLLGRLLRKTGQLDQAIHYLNKAIEEAPEEARSFIELGRCYQEQRLYDRAIQHFQNAIQLRPDDYQPYYLAGLVSKELKDFLNAERMFKSAAKLAPKNMSVYRQLAAVTAINFVQNHQSRTEIETENTSSMTVFMERTKK